MKLKALIAACLAAAPALAQPQTWAWDDGTVPYVQTPMEIVERMLRMAEVKKGDYLIDLGSGDGRIVIEAAKRGARALGVDIDPNLVRHAAENARKAEVADRTQFIVKDIFETDLSAASVVAFYLLPEFNAKLLPEKPVGVGGVSRVELWIVPADARGTWTSEIPGHGGAWSFRVKQQFQMLDIDVAAQGRDLLVRNSRLRGEEIKIIVTGVVNNRAWHHYFVGELKGDRIAGEITVTDGNNKRSFPWTATRAR